MKCFFKDFVCFFSGKIIFTGPVLQFSFTFVLLDAGGEPYCASALHWVLGGTQQCWRRCVQNYPGSNPGPSEARKEISRAQAGCSGRAIVPVLLSQLTREEKKKIAFGFFCERILGICRKCPGGESVLSSVLFPADGCHYMRYAMQRYLIAASVPHAGTLLTALLDTVLGSACCFSQSMANSCAGVKYVGPFGVTWGAAWENRL